MTANLALANRPRQLAIHVGLGFVLLLSVTVAILADVLSTEFVTWILPTPGQ